MRIGILGAGAMGMLFGAYLSSDNNVFLIDIDPAKVEKIQKDGIRIKEPDGKTLEANPGAAMAADGIGVVDLVVLFVKAMDSRKALETNRSLIGPNTFVLSLQNGAGHEAVIKDFVALDRIVIGTTQHNSSIVEPGVVYHGGGGTTFIGSMDGRDDELKGIEEAFSRSGLETHMTGDIRKKVWEKLFVNACASALTAIFQTQLGFLITSEHAWRLTVQLIDEAVAVANSEGMGFEREWIVEQVRKLLENASTGYTSIYADIRDGRKTEVDTIGGAVVAAGRRSQVPTPGHEFVVGLIHAMEEKKQFLSF
jgi:2-dehydropantoate 2-reductase